MFNVSVKKPPESQNDKYGVSFVDVSHRDRELYEYL